MSSDTGGKRGARRVACILHRSNKVCAENRFIAGRERGRWRAVKYGKSLNFR